VKAWSVQQLVEDLGLARQVTVSLETFTDRQLALLYQRCAVTLAPGLGEGFGYPIVESLASGTPVVAVDYGGGAELVPKLEWRVPSRGWRVESVYALQRPVMVAEDGKNAILRALEWRRAVGDQVCSAYCKGSIAHLGWSSLWPRWKSWIRKGL
jgi:glycosyltransferase involved in cell wall biosynthesis